MINFCVLIIKNDDSFCLTNILCKITIIFFETCLQSHCHYSWRLHGPVAREYFKSKPSSRPWAGGGGLQSVPDHHLHSKHVLPKQDMSSMGITLFFTRSISSLTFVVVRCHIQNHGTIRLPPVGRASLGRAVCGSTSAQPPPKVLFINCQPPVTQRRQNSANMPTGVRQSIITKRVQ